MAVGYIFDPRAGILAAIEKLEEDVLGAVSQSFFGYLEDFLTYSKTIKVEVVAEDFLTFKRIVVATHGNAEVVFKAMRKTGLRPDEMSTLVEILPYHNALTTLFTLMSDNEALVRALREDGQLDKLMSIFVRIAREKKAGVVLDAEAIMELLSSRLQQRPEPVVEGEAPAAPAPAAPAPVPEQGTLARGDRSIPG